MQKRILVVSPVECYPSYYGNSARIASFIEFFLARGYELCYLHLPDRAFDPTDMIEKLGQKYIFEPYRPRMEVIRKLRVRAIQTMIKRSSHRLVKVDDFIQKRDIKKFTHTVNTFKPDIVFINYTYFSKLFNYVQRPIKKILDTHDSLYLRYAQLYKGKKAIDKYRISIQDEIDALNRADTVISIQQDESDFFTKHGCRSNIYTIGYHIPYHHPSINKTRRRLLYLGAKYTANEDAILYFLNELWPVINEKFHGIELYIAGSVSHDLSAYANEGVILLGYVDNLHELYDMVDLSINPVRMGSGLKIKNIESLSFGKPVITTEVGAQGLNEFFDKGLAIAHSQADWLHLLHTYLFDDDFYNKTLRSIKVTIERYNRRNQENLQKMLND